MFTISNNDLRNLEALNLNSNHIKEISDKAFQNVPKLITLNLNQNKITGISPSGFDGIGNLQNLTMSTNKLSSIEMSSLEPLKNLVKFHLDSNKLKELPVVSTYVFNQIELQQRELKQIEVILRAKVKIFFKSENLKKCF